MPVPGSSTVVRCQRGSDQPASAAIAETVAWKASTLSTLMGFSTTCRRRAEG